MKVVTFGGNFCYYPMMNYDMVFIDDDYVQCPEKVNHPNVIHLHSGVSDDSWESRRYRIAFMLREIFSRVNDDLFLVDSDVYIPLIKPVLPTSFTIPARAKPSNDIILFNMGTNLYLPVSYLRFAHDLMDEYIRKEVYKDYYVDIYLYYRLLPAVRVVPGTCHWILGKKYCINEQYNIVQTA